MRILHIYVYLVFAPSAYLNRKEVRILQWIICIFLCVFSAYLSRKEVRIQAREKEVRERIAAKKAAEKEELSKRESLLHLVQL